MTVTLTSILRTSERAVRFNFDRRHVDEHFRENARNAIVTLRKLRARTTA